MIKCGGSIVNQLPASFYQSLVQLQKEKHVHPIIVHGGGPMISTQLELMNVTTRFVEGLRVTTEEVLDVVEMVLSGSVNKQIVRNLLDHHAQAIGMSGIDGSLLHAYPVAEASQIGYVGEIDSVNSSLLQSLTAQGYIPVISPVAIGENNQRYNINADSAAAAIAQVMQARLCFISNVPGIMIEQEGKKETLHRTNRQEIEELIASNIVYGGMIPKVQAALRALEQKVPEVAIINGMKDNAIIDFIAGKEIGTSIQLEEVSHV